MIDIEHLQNINFEKTKIWPEKDQIADLNKTIDSIKTSDLFFAPVFFSSCLFLLAEMLGFRSLLEHWTSLPQSSALNLLIILSGIGLFVGFVMLTIKTVKCLPFIKNKYKKLNFEKDKLQKILKEKQKYIDQFFNAEVFTEEFQLKLTDFIKMHRPDMDYGFSHVYEDKYKELVISFAYKNFSECPMPLWFLLEDIKTRTNVELDNSGEFLKKLKNIL